MATGRNVQTSEKVNVNDGAKDYISRKINPVLEPLVTCMVSDRPDEPAQYMANWLYHEFKVVAEGGGTTIGRLESEVAELQKRLKSIGDEDTDDDDDDKEDDDDDISDLPEVVPKGLARPRHSVSAEAYGEWNKKVDFIPPVILKSDEQIGRIQHVLRDSFLFSQLDEKNFRTVIKAMREVVLSEPTRIIHQGDDGDLLYVIETGEFKCYIKQPNQGELCVKTCLPGDAFGELALLYNTPRAASVESSGAAQLWALDRETFNHIVKDAAAKKRNMYESFLANVKLLSAMDSYERCKVADALKTETFNDGEFIIRQGDPGQKFYFIEEGGAIVTKSTAVSDAPIQVMEYRVGDYFGELALLKNEPRAANVVAQGRTKVATLDRKSFKRLMGPLEGILERNTCRYQQ